MSFVTSNACPFPSNNSPNAAKAEDDELRYVIPEGFSGFPQIGHHVQESVLPLLTISGAALVGIGTGFTVTPNGLIVTAAHVIAEALTHGIPKVRPDGGFDYELQFYALYLTNRQDKETGHYIGGVLPISKVWHITELDIGFCRLGSPYGPNGWMPTFPVFRLSAKLPAIGNKVLGCGYYQMKGNVGDLKEGSKIEVHYSQQTAYTTGDVVEIHPLKRDSAMLKFPCFRTDARFDPGMSGGPVLNEEGNVCGVICSSLPGDESNPGHVSYASLIWPALGTPIELQQSEGPPTAVLVHDLARDGIILMDTSLPEVRVDNNADGSR